MVWASRVFNSEAPINEQFNTPMPKWISKEEFTNSHQCRGPHDCNHFSTSPDQLMPTQNMDYSTIHSSTSRSSHPSHIPQHSIFKTISSSSNKTLPGCNARHVQDANMKYQIRMEMLPDTNRHSWVFYCSVNGNWSGSPNTVACSTCQLIM